MGVGNDMPINSSDFNNKQNITNDKGAINGLMSLVLRVISNILHVIITGFCLIVIASFVILSVCYVGGYHPYIVLSGSMEPNIHTGSLCVVNTNVPYGDIEKGCIIAFQAGDTMVTHRVVNITDKGIETKGDANAVSDSIITTDKNYKGLNCLSIPYLGYVYQFVQTPKGWIILATVLFGLLILRLIIGKVEKLII